MTVCELMEVLQRFPMDAEVEFADLYERSEGWGEGHDDATMPIEQVVFRDGVVTIE